MMFRNSVAWLAILATMVSADHVVQEDSFGNSGNVSPDGRKIPGWSLTGIGHTPQIMSDRIALTPPSPGNTRGAIWADAQVHAASWRIELEFRASGQEQGSGNMVLWYVQQKDVVGSNSVYSVGKFDGLAIVVDMYGGRGGSIRGFLSDGSLSFNALGSLDSLAFGHCDYSFRNLGRPSKLTVTNNNGLSVHVDDRLCFQSDQITLPAGYYPGLTAGTGDNPDAFEVFKLTMFDDIAEAPHSQPHQQERAEHREDHAAFQGSPQALPDQAADEIKSTEAQFQDLHNRLQALQHQLADMTFQFDAISRKVDSKASEIIAAVPAQDVLNRLHSRLENTERIVQTIQRDIEGRDYKGHLDELQEAIHNVRGGLTEALPESLGKIVNASAPRMGLFLFVVVAVQIMLAGTYIIYKRRRNSAPKKYL